MEDYSGWPATTTDGTKSATSHCRPLSKKNKRRRLLWCGTFVVVAAMGYCLLGRQFTRTTPTATRSSPLHELAKVVEIRSDSLHPKAPTMVLSSTTEQSIDSYNIPTSNHPVFSENPNYCNDDYPWFVVGNQTTTISSIVEEMEDRKVHTTTTSFQPIWAVSPLEKRQMLEDFLQSAFL